MRPTTSRKSIASGGRWISRRSRTRLNEMIRRHSVLRTTFEVADGVPQQRIAPALRIPLPVEDLSGLPAAERDAQRMAGLYAEARRPWSLTDGPVIRARVWRLDEHDHQLIVLMHHIVSDGWSQGLFVRELAALYDAYSNRRPSPLPELPIQYSDFAVWQRQWATSSGVRSADGLLEGCAAGSASAAIAGDSLGDQRAGAGSRHAQALLPVARAEPRSAGAVPGRRRHRLHGDAGRVCDPAVPLQRPGRCRYWLAGGESRSPGGGGPDWQLHEPAADPDRPARQPVVSGVAGPRSEERARRLRKPERAVRRARPHAARAARGHRSAAVPGHVPAPELRPAVASAVERRSGGQGVRLARRDRAARRLRAPGRFHVPGGAGDSRDRHHPGWRD